MSWVKRVEDVLDVLKGSGIEEIELAEGELEIVVRRSPGVILEARFLAPGGQPAGSQPGQTLISAGRVLDMKAPLTGVYYAAPSPTSASFINVGDMVSVGQTIALIEAMKVFSEIPSEVAGRVVVLNVQSGDVVKKGDVLFQVEPA